MDLESDGSTTVRRRGAGGLDAAIEPLPVWSSPPIVDSLLGSRAHWEPSEALPERLDEWAMWTGRPLPAPSEARAEFAGTTATQTDLSPAQAATLVDRIAPRAAAGDEPGAGSLGPWLEACRREFLARTRPWFPVWLGYVTWVLDWCQARGYRKLVFLCRDSLPFYALAGALTAQEIDPPELELAHASRTTLRSAQLATHLAKTLGPSESVAFVDTGCYGSVVSQLLDACKARSQHRPPAVLFFFSRNPMIFGYMNYLMAFETLSQARRVEPGLESPGDFTIYAGDVVESLPKPYAVESLSEHAIPDVAPSDVASYGLAGELLGELTESVGPRLSYIQEDARRAAGARYRCFVSPDAAVRAATQLFDEPAPKRPPMNGYGGALPPEALAPQREFFGVVSG